MSEMREKIIWVFTCLAFGLMTLSIGVAIGYGAALHEVSQMTIKIAIPQGSDL